MTDEFGRLINLTAVGKGPFAQSFEASEGERAALATRFGISELTSFSGHFRAEAEDDGGVALEGEFCASLIQPCRFSLEPVAEEVRDSFRVRFLPDLPNDELAWDSVDEGDLERLEGESIDAGEIVAQYLGMSINPYPQKPGVSAGDIGPADRQIISEEEARKASSPFASLKKIKDKL